MMDYQALTGLLLDEVRVFSRRFALSDPCSRSLNGLAFVNGTFDYLSRPFDDFRLISVVRVSLAASTATRDRFQSASFILFPCYVPSNIPSSSRQTKSFPQRRTMDARYRLRISVNNNFLAGVTDMKQIPRKLLKRVPK